MINKKLIIDVGMHKGEDTIHYLKSGFNVIGVEANPILADEVAKKYAKYVESNQLIILNIGIAEKEGYLTFYKNKRLTEWSSFDKEFGTRRNTQAEEVTIHCITTQQLFELYGVPYYLKVDIEGYDFVCINNLPTIGDLPDYVSCEASDIKCLEVLKDRGYTKFKLINQLNNFEAIDLKLERKTWYPRYQIVRNGIKLRLQKVFTLKHPYGSAGPFAENTKGNWVSYDEAVDQYKAFHQYSLNKPINNVSWFDFHAKLK